LNISNLLQIKEKKVETKKEYTAFGIVCGNLRMGGKGSIPIDEPITANTKKKLLEKANKQLEDNTLHEGDFDGLVCALLLIREKETVSVNEKEYSRYEFSEEYIGKEISEEERQCLYEVMDGFYASSFYRIHAI